MMRIKSLCIISLLLLLPYTALATDGTGEGNVKIIKKDGTISTDSIEKSDNFSKPSREEEPGTIPKTTSGFKTTETGMLAGQAMIENAAVNLTYSFADEFFLGGYKFASVGVNEKKIAGSDELQYSLYSTELDPFNVPIVDNTLYKTERIYYAVAICLICIAYWAFTLQHSSPKLFSSIQKGIAGEESFYDFKAVVTSWVIAIASPWIMIAWIKYVVLRARNIIVMGMTSQLVTTVGQSSDSLITYLLIRIGWYFNGLQKLMGEYGIHLIVSLTFVICAIIALLSILVSLSSAVKFTGIVVMYQLLFVLMDIITLFFVSFGIQMGVRSESVVYSTGYVLVGIVVAVVTDFLILVIPSVWLFFQSRFSRRHVRIVGF